jgi:microcystin-dependent protein
MEGTIATIMMFAGNFAPKNWALCAGQTISIASNTALFSLLGTTYGGNGTTTFNLPDLQGRTPIGAGPGNNGLSLYQLGQAGGFETATMTVNTMPSHGHASGNVQIPLSTSTPDTDQASGNILASPNGDTYALQGTTPAANYGGFTAEVTVQGSGIPFSIRQPFVGMNYVICLFGVYPYRP